MSTAVPQDTDALPVTQRARETFLGQIKQIDGVLRVVSSGGAASGDPLISVYVPSLESEAAERVLELEAAMYRLYPTARLDVAVKGIAERDIDLADLDASLPQGAQVLL